MSDQGLKTKLPLAVLALLLGGPMAAHAADLYEGPGPYRAPPPYAGPYEPSYEAAPDRGPYAPPPVMRERYGADFGPCRIFHRVRVDPYGREIVRRVRVCDGPTAGPAPAWAAAAPPPPYYGPPPPYGYGARFYGVPRPPQAMGPGPEFDDE